MKKCGEVQLVSLKYFMEHFVPPPSGGNPSDDYLAPEWLKVAFSELDVKSEFKLHGEHGPLVCAKRNVCQL